MKEFTIRFFCDDQTIVEYNIEAKDIYQAENIAMDKFLCNYDKRIMYLTSNEKEA